MKAFRTCAAITGAATFEVCVDKLKETYPEVKTYFAKHLDLHYEKWAAAFRQDVFTAGIRSTQRGESMNNSLKKCLERKGRLVTVLNAINEQLTEQDIEAQSREAIGAMIWALVTRNFLCQAQ